MKPASLFSVLISGSLQPAKMSILRGKRAEPHIQVTRTDAPGTVSVLVPHFSVKMLAIGGLIQTSNNQLNRWDADGIGTLVVCVFPFWK